MESSRSARCRTLGVTVLGAGLLRPAPGSWGSLVAVLVWLGWYWLARESNIVPSLPEAVICAAVAASVALCVRWGGWAAERFGRADPPQFVLDEFAGQLLALVFLPASAGRELLAVAAGQFLLFRLLDIIKPPPGRLVERLPGGWGIVADDLVAGAYANLLGQLIWRTPIGPWCVSAVWGLWSRL